MKIIVCMKQVPSASEVAIDPETGAMLRQGAGTRTNPYDLYALETALRIRELLRIAHAPCKSEAMCVPQAKSAEAVPHGSKTADAPQGTEKNLKCVNGAYDKEADLISDDVTITMLTMGPDQAEEMMKDGFAMGADEAVILSDRKFAGADVLATSYTLAQGIRVIGGADLIICGRQTTDGDTAQVGPAIAEHMGIPHCAWVSGIENISEEKIQVRQEFSSVKQISEMDYPCLITVDKDIYVPRLPSYKLKKQTADREVIRLSFNDLPDQDLTRYGLVGSPTSVAEMFPPPSRESQVYIEGNAAEKAKTLLKRIEDLKII